MSNKVALVTGSARGFGQSISLGLAEKGYKIVAIDMKDLNETKERITELNSECLSLQGDITSQKDVDSFKASVKEHFGHVDILINNAGIFPFGNFFELSYDDWRKTMSVNLDGIFLMSKAFVPGMKENGWGRVINTASNSITLSFPNLSHYMASKMGVIGFTRGLANDVAPYGITVNAIGPTLTKTPGGEEYVPSANMFEDVIDLQAIKRRGEPQDLVHSIRFLISEEADFITGQTYMIDGGLSRL